LRWSALLVSRLPRAVPHLNVNPKRLQGNSAPAEWSAIGLQPGPRFSGAGAALVGVVARHYRVYGRVVPFIRETHMRARYFVSATLAAAVAGTASGSLADDRVVGNWFAEGVENHQHEQFIVDRLADGTFSMQGRIVQGCETGPVHVESGTWTLEGDLLRTNTTSVGGAPSQYHDKFVVKALPDGRTSMLDLDTNVTWILVPIPMTFPLPPPQGCGNV
jgi:hypothetical protein